jgi:hypothetical protein
MHGAYSLGRDFSNPSSSARNFDDNRKSELLTVFCPRLGEY